MGTPTAAAPDEKGQSVLADGSGSRWFTRQGVILRVNDYLLQPFFYGALVLGLARLAAGLVLGSTAAWTVGIALGVLVGAGVFALAWADRHGKLGVEGDFLERSQERERTYDQRFPR